MAFIVEIIIKLWRKKFMKAQFKITITVAPEDLFVADVAVDAKVGVALDQQITPKGGTPPYTFSIDPNAVTAPGVDLLKNGELVGTPTQAGKFEFLAQAADATEPA